MMRLTLLWSVPALFAVYMPSCTTPSVRPTMPPWEARMTELWELPSDLATRDLFYGPWGRDNAPDANATFTFVRAKDHGTNPGVIVTDPRGREWHVKQPPHNDQGAEGPIEVVLSRVLSAVGYHQPPVYYLPRWTISGGPSSRVQPEGRSRPKHTGLKDEGEWSWQENPFVGTRPYNGLRVLMMILNESDLKDSNNTLYEVNEPGDKRNAARHWYVVRDIGTALGETGRLNPQRNDPALFERIRFINRVKNGAVDFNYHGRHQELADHIAPEDVRWMSDLLAQLRIEQWRDAFRAGGYDAATSERFIARIREKIAEGQALTR